ncbi:MAG: hypothetical protein ACLQUT_07660, partial [Thermoleophilia bacterium]
PSSGGNTRFHDLDLLCHESGHGFAHFWVWNPSGTKQAADEPALASVSGHTLILCNRLAPLLAVGSAVAFRHVP